MTLGAGLARRLIAAAMLTALPVAPLAAQRALARTPPPGEGIRISVLTFGQGDAVFELFGHNGLRVQDTAAGTDVIYDWGNFSFDEPNFLGRFLTGETRYWVQVTPTSLLLDAYVHRDRETQEQVLSLTAEQRARLAAFAANNARPENRYYRYDYFLDNCSTRLRDALDAVLGGTLQRRFSVVSTPWSYRSESVRLTTPSAFAQSGIDIALGPRADVPITAWESMFIPMRMRDYLREVTVVGEDGVTTPLVAEERTLYRARRAPEPSERRGLALGAWGPILGAWMLLMAPMGLVARRRTRLPAATAAALWYGVTGVLGLALALMWLGSAHVFWYRNLNLLLVSPLGLLAAVPAMRAVRDGVITRRGRALIIVVVAQAALALPLALVTSQRLAGPLLLFLPAHVGLAIAIWRHLRVAAAAPAEGTR